MIDSINDKKQISLTRKVALVTNELDFISNIIEKIIGEIRIA